VTRATTAIEDTAVFTSLISSHLISSHLNRTGLDKNPVHFSSFQMGWHGMRSVSAIWTLLKSTHYLRTFFSYKLCENITWSWLGVRSPGLLGQQRPRVRFSLKVEKENVSILFSISRWKYKNENGTELTFIRNGCGAAQHRNAPHPVWTNIYGCHLADGFSQGRSQA